jgi:lysyl-tRNA synthetase class II
VISTIRRFLDDGGFVEVERRCSSHFYGGAMTQPFTTHHNAGPRPVPADRHRAHLKRLIVGGLEQV